VVEQLAGDHAAGGDQPGIGVGRRVAALTKTGGWSDRVLLEARQLAPVPEGLDAAAAETVVVNGVTAWGRTRPRTGAVCSMPAGLPGRLTITVPWVPRGSQHR
jgi:NADPH:quinone reductase-like Zn-dependent oxidoreductase